MIHVALFDLVHFKQLNDQHGHKVGDKVLIQFVTTANETLGEHYFIYRWGGEEYLLVCLEQKTLQCHESIDDLYLVIGKNTWPNRLTVTPSASVTQLKHNGSIRSAIKRADKALYDAKNNGRNQVVTF